MAILFAALVAAMTMIYFKKETLAYVFLALGILLSIVMFWHHATDTLQINW